MAVRSDLLGYRHSTQYPGAQIPIEEKDTFIWIQGLRDTVELATILRGERRHPSVDLLVTQSPHR